MGICGSTRTSGRLLPDRGDAVALRRYVRAFGGGDLGAVMVRGEDPDLNRRLCAEIATALRAKPSIALAVDRIDTSRQLSPWLVWRHASAPVRARLAAALTPEGMRARLRESRSMLALPGSGPLAELLARDPLRLTQIAFEGTSAGSGLRSQADGRFATDGGRTCLVLIKGRGQALESAAARAFANDMAAVLAPLRAAHPGVELGDTGGHAIAAATETMIKGDLLRSGPIATVLTSIVFVLLFRRIRALAAVLPPLLLGTLWTAALASVLPGGLSAIAVAFTSVVVGVGVDTGVHVYAALLAARRAGLAPRAAADAARRADGARRAARGGHGRRGVRRARALRDPRRPPARRALCRRRGADRDRDRARDAGDRRLARARHASRATAGALDAFLRVDRRHARAGRS